MKSEPILYDLANFVAHNDERDQGISFTSIDSFVQNFIEVSMKGGTIYGKRAVFSKRVIVEKLIKLLESILPDFDETAFELQRDNIIESLVETMEEVDFKISDPRVIRCYIKRVGAHKLVFCMNINLIGPFIQISEGANIQTPLFE